jgi:hypothetical protein
MDDLQSLFDSLKALLQKYTPPLVPKANSAATYDLWSIHPVEIQGRHKKEVYFAGLVIRKSYVGFYFMPVYSEPKMKAALAPELMQLLKGKSCFHIKTLTPELSGQIEAALQTGFARYKELGWV